MSSQRSLHAGLAALCALVAFLAGIAAALGVFARGDGALLGVTSVRGETYEMATTGIYANNALQVVAEGVGWDVFTLLVAAPLLLGTAAWVARGSFRGHLIAAGLLGSFLYMYLEYAVTWAFGPLFAVFVVICGLSLVGLVGSVASISAIGVSGRFTEAFPRRAWAALSLFMSALLVVMWAGRIAQALRDGPAGVLQGETTMTVQALDLGLVVPAAVVIAALAWRRSPAGLAAAASFAVTSIAMSAAIASMMISASIVTGTLQLPPILIFGSATLAGLLVAARMSASTVPMSHPDPFHGARPVDLPAAGA